jgi:hypothetical protein
MFFRKTKQPKAGPKTWKLKTRNKLRRQRFIDSRRGRAVGEKRGYLRKREATPMAPSSPPPPPPPPPRFQPPEQEQRAMVEGGATRLREYRRLLPSGDLGNNLHGRFWDAVVVTAANARQARVYATQLDGLHARGQLPGDRARYIVVADPAGARVGRGVGTTTFLPRCCAPKHIQSL